MSIRRKWLAIGAILLLTAGCAEPKPRTKAAAPATTSSGQFDGVGTVTLHQGEPCAPQIMFDFHAGFGETVALAAGFKNSRTLTDAAKQRRRVRIAGTWRHARTGDCRYVDVTTVEK